MRCYDGDQSTIHVGRPWSTTSCHRCFVHPIISSLTTHHVFKTGTHLELHYAPLGWFLKVIYPRSGMRMSYTKFAGNSAKRLEKQQIHRNSYTSGQQICRNSCKILKISHACWIKGSTFGFSTLCGLHAFKSKMAAIP